VRQYEGLLAHTDAAVHPRTAWPRALRPWVGERGVRPMASSLDIVRPLVAIPTPAHGPHCTLREGNPSARSTDARESSMEFIAP
jgi:hypothetical protein